MRIALVHMRHAASGGTERYLNHLAAHLAEQGHTVTIVCRRHEAPPHPAVRFAILRPLALGRAHRMFSFARAVERHVRQTSYDTVMGLGKTWTHDVIRLGGGCHQTFLDHTRPPHSIAPFSSPGLSLRHRCALALEARGLARGAYCRVITNSAMVKRDVMARRHVPEDAIAVIPNGVETERFHPRHRTDGGARLRRQLGFDASHFVLAFVGMGYQRKGLDRLLRAFPMLQEQQPASRLLVVGHDSSLKRWRQRAEHLGVAASVRFLGERRDVDICYGASDLFVLPTRYDPFANATLEALASGLPVITTSSNGGCEILQHGIHGSIMDDADHPEALLQALLPWLDRGRLQYSSRMARALAKDYSRQREMERSTDVLMEATAAKRNHA